MFHFTLFIEIILKQILLQFYINYQYMLLKDLGAKRNTKRGNELVFLQYQIFFLNHRSIDTHVNTILRDCISVSFFLSFF